jgi:hypothetical protein
MPSLAFLLSLGPRSEAEVPPGPSVTEAREAHAYWRARASRLPWHRFAARAEARNLARRWHARLLRAQLEHWRLGFLAPLLRVPAESLATLYLRRVRRVLVAAAATVVLGVVALWALVVIALVQLF